MTMRTFKSAAVAAVLAAFSYVPLQAHAGLFDDEEARKAILELRGKLDAMQRDLRDLHNSLDTKSDKSGTLDLLNQNEQLRQDVAKLRGQVEVLTNEVANTQQRQKDFYVDLDNRMRKMEPQRVTVDGKEASVEPAEQKSYDAALAIFKAGDYRGAAASFIDFQRRYPQSGYSASSQYWLGNAYYAQRDYRNAIAAQQTLLASYPDSPKAADALLNIASCYVELKDKPAAKKTLETLVAKYPDSTVAETSKERLAALR